MKDIARARSPDRDVPGLDRAPALFAIVLGELERMAFIGILDSEKAIISTATYPLLFKGKDFSKTDIVPAWRP